MKFEAPSGSFAAVIRKATWGDQKLRAPLAETEIVHRQNGDGVFRRTSLATDLAETEIRAVVVEIQVKVDRGEGVTEMVPLQVERDAKGRYKELEFSEWIGDQDPEDVIALHAEVINENPLWKSLV